MQSKLLLNFSKMASVEGEVTEVCQDLLYFKIKHTTVHLLLYFINNYSSKFPEEGAAFKIKSRCFNSKGGYVSSLVAVPEESTVEGDFVWCFGGNNSFINMMREANPTPEEVLQFAKNYDNFCKYLKSKCGDKCAEIFQSVIYKLNGNLNFKLSFPSQLKFVENEKECYKDYNFYTFGINWNYITETLKNYLLGFLCISKINGIAYLTDNHTDIPCIITSEWNYFDCYILIEDYIVINEVYNGTQFYATQYLLIDSSKIIRLDVEIDNKEIPPSLFFLQVNKYKNIVCQIVKKSLFMAAASNRSHFWLEIYVNDQNKSFISLDSSYTNIYNLLRPGKWYALYYKTSPTRTSNKEVAALNSILQQFDLPPQSFFIPTNLPQQRTKILTVNEAFQTLHTSDLVSFEGVISLKKFVTANSSRTQQRTRDSKFGTPSTKTHVLEFSNDSRPLVLYINNWENMCVPYCLVPNMRVIVHNVKPQSRKYFKSTVMTSFEIIKYEPKVQFESANLCQFSWGLPYFLGGGKEIPRDTIIWTRILSFFILGLKIYVTPNKELDPTITLVCLDNMGESKVIAKSKTGLSLLKLLLGMQEPMFKKWCNSFCNLGSYHYFKGIKILEITDKGIQGTIKRSLTRYFEDIEDHDLSLELKCRKIDTESSGKPVYYFLEGRRSKE